MFKILDLTNGTYISLATVFDNNTLDNTHMLCYTREGAEQFIHNNIKLWYGRKEHEFEPVEVLDV
jgi:hypothetical protein